MARRLPLSLPRRTGPESWSRTRQPNRLSRGPLSRHQGPFHDHNMIVASSIPKARPFHKGRNLDCFVASSPAMYSTQSRGRGRRAQIRSRPSGARLRPISQPSHVERRPQHIITCAWSNPSPKACEGADRGRYTRASCLLTKATSVSRTIPGLRHQRMYEQAEGAGQKKKLTGPPAKAAAACPRGCEAAGAGPPADPATAGAAAGAAATRGPASRSPCPCCRHSSPPASTTSSRTSTSAAWAALPAIALGAPSCGGRRKGIASRAAAARTASGPVAAVTPPFLSSEASMAMCCGLHLGDYIVFTVSYESLLNESRDIGR